MLEILAWVVLAIVAVGLGLLIGTIVAALACGAHRDLPDTNTDADAKE